MKSPLLKGIVMTLITVLATALTTGIPSTLVAWELLGITTLGTVLTYVAKNAVFPSTSVLGTIDLKDLLSGVILSIGSGLSSLAADKITGSSADIKTIGSVMLTVAIGYLCKNFLSQPSATTATNANVSSTKTLILLAIISTTCLCSCSTQAKIEKAKQRVELNEDAFAVVGSDWLKLNPCLNDSTINYVSDTLVVGDTIYSFYPSRVKVNDTLVQMEVYRDTILKQVNKTWVIHDSVKVVAVDKRQLAIMQDSVKKYNTLYYQQIALTGNEKELKKDYMFWLIGVSVALAASIALRFIKFSV
jgi:hypothetical protein